MSSSLTAAAHARMPEMVDIRRRMHRRPEVGLDLPETRALILQELEGSGLDVRLHHRTSGIVALMEGPRPDGPVTLLRADHDGLPLVENTGLDFASETGSTMHACGHDLHTAMLIGAVRLLDEHRADLPGPVVFMFQPGEEGHHGAQIMIDEGVLDAAGRRPARAFALHVFTSLEAGVVGLRTGALMAASDQFRITLTGRGGHASSPHLALDPIPAGAEIVLAMQTAVTRRISVLDPAVVTFGHIEAGSASNIIPETVFMHGTIRTLSEATRSAVHELVVQVSEGVAAAHGIGCDILITDGYPVTINDPNRYEKTLAVARQVLGEECVVELPQPLMVAEDWSYVLREVPGVMALLGACPADTGGGRAPMNHSDKVVFDEAVMADGAALYAAVALDPS